MMVGAGVFEETVDGISASVWSRAGRECLLQLRPVYELVFVSERVLHVAQGGFVWAIGISSFKAPAGLSIVFAQCLEPAFGFFSQIVKSGS